METKYLKWIGRAPLAQEWSGFQKTVSNDFEIKFFFFFFKREMDAKSVVDTAIGTEKE